LIKGQRYQALPTSARHLAIGGGYQWFEKPLLRMALVNNITPWHSKFGPRPPQRPDLKFLAGDDDHSLFTVVTLTG